MAKLSDLRSMLDEARARVRVDTPKTAQRVNGSNKRMLGAKKHADGDIDIGHAFADVTRLPATKKAGVARPQPAPLARRVAFGVSARTRARASSSMERRSESFAIVNVSADAFEIGFGVERGHASRAGGRHRLPIHMIGNIACGKHTRHRRRGRVALAAALDADIAAGHVELTLEDLRIRRVADRDENA